MAPATSARESFAGRFPPPPEITLKIFFFFQEKKKDKGMYFLRLSFFLVILTALTDL